MLAAPRHDWTRAEVLALLDLPFADLLQRAHSTHRAHHDANAVQVSTLLSIKTGGCPEDCAYCPQAARYATGVEAEKLMSDYYNHNLDSAPEFYGAIIHTREYQDRLDTLGHVRDAGLKTCCGGIVGMGETREQRAGLLHTLATLPAHPQSVPINRLVQVEGTPLAGTAALDPFEFVRMIAVARILMPVSMVRLSAGRESMSDELQALCFVAGSNSIFYGEKLLTTGNPDTEHDQALFARLGIHAMRIEPDTVHADIAARPAAEAAA